MAGPSRLDELTARARRILSIAPTPDTETRSGGGEERSPHANPLPLGEAARSAGEGHSALSTQHSALILGIDPGTATMGYGIVRALDDGSGAYEAVAYDVFETPAGEPMHLRLRSLYERLAELLRTYRPDEAAVEKLFFGRNTTTALTVGQARGIALLAIAQADLAVAEYTPAEVKFALSSYGRATKNDIQRMTQLLLRLPSVPQPDDAADALAIALCHAHSMRAHALGMR